MTVDIGDLVSEGFDRTVARNGLLFAAAFYALSVANSLLTPDIPGQSGMRPGSPMMPADQGPALGLSPGVAGVLGLLLGLVSLVVTIGAVRTFVTAETEAVPTEHFTRDLGWVLLNTIVGGIVFGLAVGVGFALLIVPGLFLLVSLFFWNYFVIVENENFVDGFRLSWEVTKGERLPLFGLGVVVVLVGLVVSVVFGIPALVLPGVVGVAVNQVGAALVSVFTVATASRTYVRLTGSGRGSLDPAREAEPTT